MPRQTSSTSLCRRLVLAATLLSNVLAFPGPREGVKTIKSKIEPGVEISYKETSLCDSRKNYAGYVHLPNGTIDDTGIPQAFAINTFWCVFICKHYKELSLNHCLAGGCFLLENRLRPRL